jgi:hypothetical protein
MDISGINTTHFAYYYGQFTVPDNYAPSVAFFTSQIPSIPGFSAPNIVFTGAPSPNYSYVSVANINDPDFSFASTDDFTIEWFQHNNATTGFGRPFSIGSYSNSDIKIGVSYENTFYVWVNQVPHSFAGISSNQWMTGTWIHIAIVRISGVVTVYINGLRIGSQNIPDAVPTSTDDLVIGNESPPSSDGILNSQITNFRWVKGTGIYTDNFDTAIPTTPLTAATGTKLLLLASTAPTVTADSSGLNKVVTGHNIIWAAS